MSLKPPYPHGRGGENDNSEMLKCLLWKKTWGMSGELEPPSYRDNPHTIYPVESTTSLYIFVGMVRYHQFESHAYRRIFAFRFFSCRKLRST